MREGRSSARAKAWPWDVRSAEQNIMKIVLVYSNAPHSELEEADFIIQKRFDSYDVASDRATAPAGQMATKISKMQQKIENATHCNDDFENGQV